jgi:cytochrome P450
MALRLAFTSESAGPADPADVQDFLHDPVGCLSRVRRNYGRLTTFERDGQPFYFAFGPEYNQTVFGDLDAFHIVAGVPGPKRSAQRRLGRGMFSLNGEEHRQARRQLMPPFRKEALGRQAAALTELIDEFFAGWRPGQSFDLMHEMQELTLGMAARVLFGVEDPAAAHAVKDSFAEWLELDHVVAFGVHLPVDAPPGSYDALLAAAERLEDGLRTLVECKHRRPDAEGSLLGLMLRARAAGAMEDVDLIGQTFTLFNAAYHTTTYALTWVQFLLAQHPSIMRRLDAELRGCPAGPSQADAVLNGLPLLDHVVKESLRLLPSIVYLCRRTTRAVELGPHRLAPGTMVLVSPYVSHHLAEEFPRPERFDPDRWSSSPPAWSYIPFGGGARLCLGAPLATLFIKLTLVHVLRRFRLQVVPGSRIDRHGTLSLGARFGVPVTLHPPDGAFAASAVSGDIHEMADLWEMPRELRRVA